MTSEEANTHMLFNLMVINDGQLLIKMYTELDTTFQGPKVLNVGMLITEDPSQMLDKNHHQSYLAL